MALTKISRLEAIQFTDDGTLMVRMQKRTILDGEVLKEEWHRTAIPPDVDADAKLAAVNVHLQAMGYEPLPAPRVAVVKGLADGEHTKAVRDAYAAKLALAAAKLAIAPVVELGKPSGGNSLDK